MVDKIAHTPKGEEEKEMKELVDKLKIRDKVIVKETQDKLIEIGHPKATEAIIKFALTTKDDSVDFAYNALEVLLEIGKPAAERLIECFFSKNPKLRSYAIGAFCLPEFENYKEAVPGLIQILEKEGPNPWYGDYRLDVARALGSLGDERAVPALKKAVSKADYMGVVLINDALEKISSAKRSKEEIKNQETNGS
jgi:HEAT repeat protein